VKSPTNSLARGAKDNTTGASNSICCMPACEKYSCSSAKGLMKIPTAKEVGGTTDEVPTLEKKT